MKVLVAGGAGYIGSHTVLELLRQGHEVAAFDSFEKGHKEALAIIQEITAKEIKTYEGNLLDREVLRKAILDFRPESIIHFAAYIEVGESVKDPIKYYQNNIIGGLNIVSIVKEAGVNKLVFSSTAAVFGQPEEVPITEETFKAPINPYGSSKLMFEKILEDTSITEGFNYVVLRYFNACGCEEEGRIGEDHAPESHLIPLIMDAAQGKRDSISVFGTDYETKDGTCVRDYVHVLDLADAHIRALDFMNRSKESSSFNLGSSTGFTVREIIEKVKEVTGKDFTVNESDRRPGDPAVLVANNQKAKELLGWQPKYSLDEIIRSAWKWETQKGKYEY